MANIDKRLELLEALVIAVKNTNQIDNEELDFVEYYNIPYVRELVDKINIEKYKEIVDYIKDINDCSYYTELFLSFDNSFNIINNYNDKKPFETKNTLDFMKIVKQIYDNENIESVFIKYKDYLNNLETDFNNKYKIDFKDKLKNMYGDIDNINFIANISLLINGGFSAQKDNIVSYVKSIKIDPKTNEIEFNEYTINCLFHEYSHFFVNKIVDKNFNKLNNIDILYDESIENNLPKTYQNKKTLLYEYFVRANTLILSKDLISEYEYDEDVKWDISLGFVRINELIEIINEGLKNNLKFEDVFNTSIIEYFNNLNHKLKKFKNY